MPLDAVLIMSPGICLCQWSSLISVCPWCMNNSCGGNSFTSDSSQSLMLSFSTAKSQSVSWLSSPEAANTVPSVGCHSTEVMCEMWCLNAAIGFGAFDLNCLKSHILITPSSPPEAMNVFSVLFQEITLISESWADSTDSIQLDDCWPECPKCGSTGPQNKRPTHSLRSETIEGLRQTLCDQWVPFGRRPKHLIPWVSKWICFSCSRRSPEVPVWVQTSPDHSLPLDVH